MGVKLWEYISYTCYRALYIRPFFCRCGYSFRVLSNSSAVARDIWSNNYDPALASTDARDGPWLSGDGGCPERPECNNGNICVSAPGKEPQCKAAHCASRDRSTERTQVSTEAGHL